jgi:uncharacterized membrane protein (GlpM family)
MVEYILSFIIGGLLTTIIVYCEVNGFPLISRIAALFPLFTWLSYLFIGSLTNSARVVNHTLFVGNHFCMDSLYAFYLFFAQMLGSTKAIIGAIIIFLVLSTIFSAIYKVA